MDHFGPAWNIFKDNLVPYAVYVLVFGLVGAFTLGLGFLALTPNYYRGLQKAVTANAGPEVGDLFVFDHISDDVVTMLLMAVAVGVGFMLCFLPGLILSFAFFWVPLLAAVRAYEPADALKASFHAFKADPVPVILFAVVVGVVNSIVGNLVLPLLITAPVFALAKVLWFNQHQGDIKQIADGEGINARA